MSEMMDEEIKRWAAGASRRWPSISPRARRTRLQPAISYGRGSKYMITEHRRQANPRGAGMSGPKRLASGILGCVRVLSPPDTGGVLSATDKGGVRWATGYYGNEFVDGNRASQMYAGSCFAAEPCDTNA